MFYAWAWTRAHEGALASELLPIVQPILSRTGNIDSPYVLWRLDQLEELLGLPRTASTQAAAGPSSLAGPDDLTELWGATMRCARNSSVCTNSPISDEQVAIAATTFPDDLSLAAAIEILGVRSGSGYRDVLRQAVELRRVRDTGLIRQSRFSGSIEASFYVLEMAPWMFPGSEPKVTGAEIARRLTAIPLSDYTGRLRALAVLRAVSKEDWSRYAPEVQRIFDSVNGMTVTADTVVQFVDIATTFGVMQLDAPQGRFVASPVKDSESRYAARVAVGNAWAFQNGADILSGYKEERVRAKNEAPHPAEPLLSYIAGLGSLNGQGIDVSQDERAAISQGIKDGLLGCTLDNTRTDALFRLSKDVSAPCSLRMTVGLIKTGFVE